MWGTPELRERQRVGSTPWGIHPPCAWARRPPPGHRLGAAGRPWTWSEPGAPWAQRTKRTGAALPPSPITGPCGSTAPARASGGPSGPCSRGPSRHTPPRPSPSLVPAAPPPQPGPQGVPAGPAPAAPADTPRPGPLHHWSGQLQTLGLLRKLPPCGPPDGAWPGAASQGTKLSLLRACLRKPQQGHQSREPASEKGLTVGKASPLETALRNTTWQAPGCWPGLVRNSGTEAACRTWAPS